MKKKLLIILITISLLGCKTNSITKIDFDKGNYKLYFVGVNSRNEVNKEQCEYIKKHRIFCIDDLETLKKIQKDYLSEISNHEIENDFNCYYVLQLIKNKKLKWGAFLDWNNQYIKSTNDLFSFNTDELVKDSMNIRTISSYALIIHELQTARYLYNLLVENNTFVYPIQFMKENPLFLYNGEIELMSDTSKINIKRDFKLEIIHDLDCFCQSTIISWNFDMTESSNVYFKINVDRNIENEISANFAAKYKIIKSYKPLENIQLLAIDISEEKLKQIIETNKLKGITLTKI